VTRVLAKEFRIRGKQAGIQNLQDAREIDLGVLGIWVVAMNTESESAE
jgi:hypothetical protein